MDKIEDFEWRLEKDDSKIEIELPKNFSGKIKRKKKKKYDEPEELCFE